MTSINDSDTDSEFDSGGFEDDLDQDGLRLKRLTEEFQSNSSPSFEIYSRLSRELGMSELSVYQWFATERHRFREETSDELTPSNFLSHQLNLSLTKEQLSLLNLEFVQNPNLTVDKCCLLAGRLGLSKILVYKWFKSRLHKVKKKSHAKISKIHNQIENGGKTDKMMTISANLNTHARKTTKKRAQRCVFSSYELSRLKGEFLENPSLTKERRGVLAQELGLKDRQILDWFSAYRRKMIIANLNFRDRESRRLFWSVLSQSRNEEIDACISFHQVLGVALRIGMSPLDYFRYK
uniref:Homeobox domain-containing protein n=1 Tax=Timema douglasi TaxID=61478 RepID=A0A7R8VF19_TIMDO|nr:unnamed protein product [Timema douglasi]